jgi:hypothetical protein
VLTPPARSCARVPQTPAESPTPVSRYRNAWKVTDPETGASATAVQSWTKSGASHVDVTSDNAPGAVPDPSLENAAHACAERPPMLAHDEWPERGVLVRQSTSEVVLVIDASGAVLGRTDTVPARQSGGEMWALRPGESELVDISPTFDWAAGEGFSLPELGRGQWPYTFPAPDGQWVLGQHTSDSCEGGHSFFVKRTGEEFHAVSGETGTDINTLTGGIAYGWLDARSAVVALGVGGCGAGDKQPGIYVATPHAEPQMLAPHAGQAGMEVAVFFRSHDAPSEPVSAPTTIEEARAKWTYVDAQDYSFDYSQSCFCPFGPDPMHITVRNGRVTDVDQNPEGGPIIPTIEDLFDRVAEYNELAHLHGGSAVTEYDAETGAPLSLDSDPWPNAVDDELKFTVTNLTIEE